MNATLSVTERGNITLPAKMRKELGIVAHSQLLAEVTPEGILLKPAVTLPIELYSEERIKGFEDESNQLSGFLKAKSVK